MECSSPLIIRKKDDCANVIDVTQTQYFTFPVINITGKILFPIICITQFMIIMLHCGPVQCMQK